MNLQWRLAVRADTAGMAIAQQPLRQRPGTPGTNQTSNLPFVDNARGADVIVQRPLLRIEGNDNVADIENHRA